MPQVHSNDERGKERPERTRVRRRRVYSLEHLEPRVLLSGAGAASAATSGGGVSVPVVLTADLLQQIEALADRVASGAIAPSTATSAASTVNSTTQSAGSSHEAALAVDAVFTSASVGLSPTQIPAGTISVVPGPSTQHDVTTVQKLPDSDEVVVHGTITVPNRSDFYQVAINPRTQSYRVELNGGQDPSSGPKSLLLINGNGEVVGNWRISRPTTDLVVDFRPSHDQASTQTFYLGVTGDGGPGGVPSPYDLRLSRQVSSEPASPGPSPNPSSTPTPTATAANTRPAAVTAVDIAPSRAEALTGMPVANLNLGQTPAIDEQALGLAQGASVPLPLRAPGPLGGILSDADPTPFVDRRSATVVDLALVDLSPDASVDASAETAEHDVEAAPPVILLRGPGGLPLMSAVRPSDDMPQAGSGISATAATAWLPVLEPSDPGFPRESFTRRLVKYPIGLCFVAVLSFSMLLPDLSSAFDALRPRRRPLPRIPGVDFGREEDRDAVPIS